MIFYLTEVQEKIGYEFKNPEIIRRAFTHPSYVNMHKTERDYDRLEFLGDSVLGFVVTDYIFRSAQKDEGAMTEDKKNIVSSKPLSTATKNLQIEGYMLKSENVKMTDSMRENLFESTIGAIYLDGGLEEAKKFIYKNLIDVFYKKGFKELKDSKSLLNEFTSKNHLGDVKYVMISKTGKDNLPTFKIKTVLNGKEIAVGKGNSKKEAEQQAAKKSLDVLKRGINA